MQPPILYKIIYSKSTPSTSVRKATCKLIIRHHLITSNINIRFATQPRSCCRSTMCIDPALSTPDFEPLRYTVVVEKKIHPNAACGSTHLKGLLRLRRLSKPGVGAAARTEKCSQKLRDQNDSRFIKGHRAGSSTASRTTTFTRKVVEGD